MKMKKPFIRLAALAVASLAACLAEIADGQGVEPPPRQDTVSPTGVSYKSGSFSYHVRDLSIGGGEFPQGLEFDRNYQSSLDGSFSGGFSEGWSHNFVATVTNKVIPNAFVQPPQGQEQWLYSVSIGGRSAGFVGGSANPTGGFVGSYEPANRGGESLVFTGTEQTGTFTFTDRDGTVLQFGPRSQGVLVTTWTAPDGTRLDFTYGGLVRSVVSSRGYALIMEMSSNLVRKACVVNMAQTYVTATSTCPVGAQSATYSYAASPNFPSADNLIGATDPVGQTTSFAYLGTGIDHLGCIQLPGQSTCQISNTYNVCHRKPTLLEDPPGLRLMDQIVSQVTATGETYTYSFPADPECPNPHPLVQQTAMGVSGVASTAVTTNGAGLPTAVTDPVNRTTNVAYYPPYRLASEATQLRALTRPAGNEDRFTYDTRGNLVERRRVAQPGSNLGDIVTRASYPLTCGNPKTCNQPDYVMDANSNRTDFTYVSEHGGVLTVTGPAPSDGAPRPQTRHEYAQRYAWILNSSAGYVHAATPIWVRTSTSLCRTSAATGNAAAPCATAGDEARTAYDYGPDSGPNNLLLRGQTVTSTDGGVSTTLRTCYGYDRDGRRISETQPNANLASCP
jgi:YD repeat-containing protein